VKRRGSDWAIFPDQSSGAGFVLSHHRSSFGVTARSAFMIAWCLHEQILNQAG